MKKDERELVLAKPPELKKGDYITISMEGFSGRFKIVEVEDREGERSLRLERDER